MRAPPIVEMVISDLDANIINLVKSIMIESHELPTSHFIL